MRAKIVKIEEKDSKYGGFFYFIFFKGEDGKSYRTCVYPRYGNFKRWQPVINDFTKDGIKEIWLDGLVKKGERLIDADSLFTVKKEVLV